MQSPSARPFPIVRPGRALGCALTALALALGGCSRGAPKGQVVATVNGQEITAQDLASEARSQNNITAPAPTLLQNVIGRVLLAQAAHRNKLDAYPGFPSDMTRLKEDFLAHRMLQSVIKPIGAPTPAQVAQTLASHPYQFDRRMRVTISQLKFSGEDGLRAIAGLDSLDAMAARLKSLGVPYEQHDRTLDTAQLPDPLAANLESAPMGQPFVLQEGGAVNEIVVRSREPVDLPAAQQQALAAQVARQEIASRQVQAQVDQLSHQAHIAYQPGYAPPKPAAAAKGG